MKITIIKGAKNSTKFRNYIFVKIKGISQTIGVLLKYFTLLFFFSLIQGLAQESSDFFCLKIKNGPFEEKEFKTEPMAPCMGFYLSVPSQNWECNEDSTIEWELNFNCRFSKKNSTPLPIFTESCNINCPPLSPTPGEGWGNKFSLTQAEPEIEKIPEEMTDQVKVPVKPFPKKKSKKVPKKVAAVKPTAKKNHKTKKVAVVTPTGKKTEKTQRKMASEVTPVSKKTISTDSSPSNMNFLIFSMSYENSQYQKSTVESLDFDWNPTYHFQKNWAARGQLGYHVRKVIYKDPNGSVEDTSTFPIIPLAGYLNYISDWFLISGGGGAQFWLEPGNQKFYGFASLGLAYFFTKKSWLLERIFFNYNQVYSNNDPIDEYVLGVSFKF